MRGRRFCASLIFGLLAACGSDENQADIEAAREHVKAEMRDPASAEFKEERVRTLWSKDGTRVRVYCADVNGANAYGGKTGYQPVIHVLDTNVEDDGNGLIYPQGETYFYRRGMTENYYLMCVRDDTERPNDGIDVAIAFGQESEDAIMAHANELVPVMSNEVAPELRD